MDHYTPFNVWLFFSNESRFKIILGPIRVFTDEEAVAECRRAQKEWETGNVYWNWNSNPKSGDVVYV